MRYARKPGCGPRGQTCPCPRSQLDFKAALSSWLSPSQCSAGPEVAAELDELAELERDCCAFASWSVRSAGDTLVLDVSADGEVAVAAVHAMFDSLPTAS